MKIDWDEIGAKGDKFLWAIFPFFLAFVIIIFALLLLALGTWGVVVGVRAL